MAARTRMGERGSLARRIFFGLASFAVVALLVFGVAAASVFYYSYEDLVEHVQQTADKIDGMSTEQAVAYLSSLPWSSLRCTLIESDGTVVYDNQADIATMGNHADRQEFQQAEQSGTATSLRLSKTLGVDMLYAAARLDDGSVVRLAESRRSLVAFLGGLLPSMAAAAGLIIAASFALSRLLTRRIMQPIDQMDLSDPLQNQIYGEMRPLLARIDEQQAQLKEQNKELEAAVATRREFSANVSHEMKTPLQVISGYSELIQAGMVSPEDTVRFAGLIHSEADSMRALIDDVLTLSRLDESALGQSEISDVDMAWLAGQVVNRLKTVADEREVTVTLAPCADEMRVRGSEMLLEETIYNLVDNAIRYNHPDGNVTIAFERRTEEGAPRVVMTVADTGQGIPPDMRERVFERFFRLEQGRSRETGGTGLGLAIVKHAVQRYGGTVQIKDNPHGGSTFVVDFPAAPAGPLPAR